MKVNNRSRSDESIRWRNNGAAANVFDHATQSRAGERPILNLEGLGQKTSAIEAVTHQLRQQSPGVVRGLGDTLLCHRVREVHAARCRR